MWDKQQSGRRNSKKVETKIYMYSGVWLTNREDTFSAWAQTLIKEARNVCRY